MTNTIGLTRIGTQQTHLARVMLEDCDEVVPFAEGSAVTDLMQLHRESLLVATIFAEPDEITVELIIPEWVQAQLDAAAASYDQAGAN